MAGWLTELAMASAGITATGGEILKWLRFMDTPGFSYRVMFLLGRLIRGVERWLGVWGLCGGELTCIRESVLILLSGTSPCQHWRPGPVTIARRRTCIERAVMVEHWSKGDRNQSEAPRDDKDTYLDRHRRSRAYR